MATLTVQFDGTGRLALPGKLPVIYKVGDRVTFTKDGETKTGTISLITSSGITCSLDNGEDLKNRPNIAVDLLTLAKKVDGGRKSRKRKSRKTRRYRRV